MSDLFQQPRATCPVLRRPPGELEPWTAHMVSMMQALQSGAGLTIYPGRITWATPDRTTLGFTNRQQGELHNIGILADIGLVQGMAMDEHLELLFVTTEGLIDATKQSARVATGRRSNPAGGYQGYVVWQRQGTPNRPRIEIPPDQVITRWYHWPEGDDQPSQPAMP